MSNVDEIHETADGAVQFGPYRIHELIGAGGMAEVYRALLGTETEEGERAVVIKRVKPKHASDPGFVRMFVDEARLSAQLKHPNIVEVLDHGEIEGHHYIAMEYIDGLHLQAAHVRHVQVHGSPMPWQAGVLLVRDALWGLDYAHHKQDEEGRPMGLVHRDINLVNIMVARNGAVKLLDFGIVKAADGIRSAETVGGVLKGKFGYMSPEQAEGRPLDPRSDVFSAAIVLHELITGRRLFWGKDDLDILRKVRAGEIPDPRKYCEDVPEAVVQVVMKGLARDLDERYGSARLMAEALDEIVKEHELSESLLPELMAGLLPPQEDSAAETMRRRRKRMTLLAWKAGVREAEASGSRSAAGVLGEDAHPATALAKKKTLQLEADEALDDKTVESLGALEEATLIVTEARWLVPDGEVTDVEAVLGEQDFTSVADARLEDGTVDEATLILVGSAEDDEVTDAERALFTSSPGTPRSALADAETRILADDEVSGAEHRTLWWVLAAVGVIALIVLLTLKFVG